MISFKNLVSENADYDRIYNLGKTLEDHYHISPEHHKAIENFTKNSGYMNSYLWDKKDNKAFNHGDIDKLDKITAAHKTPHDLTLFSKTRHDPRVKKNSEGIFHHPAFISTSLDNKVAMGLKWNEQRDKHGITHHHIMEIKVPKGHRGLYIGSRSHYKTQREFLLPRGLNLKYHNTNTQECGKYHYHIHKMELTNE